MGYDNGGMSEATSRQMDLDNGYAAQNSLREAQGTMAELQTLIKDIRTELLERADMDTDGKLVVPVGRSVWFRIKKVVQEMKK